MTSANPPQPVQSTSHASPLQLTDFNDLEDELFGAPCTPERTEYEDRVTLQILPKSSSRDATTHVRDSSSVG